VLRAIDALVIGGGVSGGALAAQLAQAGREVILVERKAGPHEKVCGGFVGPEALRYLAAIGVDLSSLAANPIATVGIHSARATACVRLPFYGFGVSRRVLDEAILNRAASHGAALKRGSAVISLRRDGMTWVARLDGGSEIVARDAFLATGKHDLQGWRRPAVRHNDLIAFNMHWRLPADDVLASASRVELCLYRGGYAGIQLVGEDILNLCLVVPRKRLIESGGNWLGLQEALRREMPILGHKLRGAEPVWDRPLAITAIPYGFVQAQGDELWRLGDQAAVIPSFTGDGIAMALHSARMAATYYLSGRSSSRFQAALAIDFKPLVRRSTLISGWLESQAGQSLATSLARVTPGLVRIAARCTRIPAKCLISGG
jgi:flavin-dependent dehydrogenase